jgi:integrase
MASIQKQPNGRFKAIVKSRLLPEGRVFKTFDTQKAAKAWAVDIMKAANDGNAAEHRRSFDDLVTKYLADPHVSARLKAYDRTMVEFWRRTFAGKRLAEIRRAHVMQARNDLSTRKPTRRRKEAETDTLREHHAPATVDRHVSRLSVMLGYAVDLEWITANPLKGAKSLLLRRDNTRSDEAVTIDEDALRSLMVAASKSESATLLPFILTARGTGLRAGELMNLRWRDVDLTRPSLTVQKSKNGSKRTVPIMGEAVAMLVALKADQSVARIDGAGFVFTNSDGSGPYRYRAWWEAARAAAGLANRATGGNFRFHDFRHGFVSTLAEAGVSIESAMRVTGHKTFAMFKRYEHYFKSNAEKVAATAGTNFDLPFDIEQAVEDDAERRQRAPTTLVTKH